MATSSLAAALETLEIVRLIDSCTGLLPGVAASTENLQPLLEHISKTRSWASEQDDVKVAMFQLLRGKKNPRLEVVIEGPIETVASDVPGFWGKQRADIDRKFFDSSVDGLAEALTYARQTADSAPQRFLQSLLH